LIRIKAKLKYENEIPNLFIETGSKIIIKTVIIFGEKIFLNEVMIYS